MRFAFTPIVFKTLLLKTISKILYVLLLLCALHCAIVFKTFGLLVAYFAVFCIRLTLRLSWTQATMITVSGFLRIISLFFSLFSLLYSPKQKLCNAVHFSRNNICFNFKNVMC